MTASCNSVRNNNCALILKGELRPLISESPHQFQPILRLTRDHLMDMIASNEHCVLLGSVCNRKTTVPLISEIVGGQLAGLWSSEDCIMTILLAWSVGHDPFTSCSSQKSMKTTIPRHQKEGGFRAKQRIKHQLQVFA